MTKRAKNFSGLPLTNKGSAFLLAMVFILLSLMAGGLFQRHVRMLIKLREKETVARENLNIINSGLSRGMEFMESAVSLPDNYTCRYSTAPEGALVFQYMAPNWLVSATTEPAGVAIATCTCPADFSQPAQLWENCS